MITPLSSLSLHFEYDLVATRRRARQIAALLGFEEQDQTRIAAVTSEIARNALQHGSGGRVEFALDRNNSAASLLLTVTNRGSGKRILEDDAGIVGARRLMDDLQISTKPGQGATVTMRKVLPSRAPDLSGNGMRLLMDELSRQRSESPLEEIQQQNAELLHALGELSERRSEEERVHQEMEDTNRGVLALVAELDEKEELLRRVDQMKTRLLSDMSKDLRTPVNAILALARLLAQAPLAEENQQQVALIRRAAEDLERLVNDLRDFARTETGGIEVRPAPFEVASLYGVLRGMVRPLLVDRSLSLVFEDPDALPVMFSDEGKVAQILRELISTSLKYTTTGEVRVSAELVGDAICFRVADSATGVAAEDQERIFEGLPRKLATLLGGKIGVRTTPGVGSTFWVEIPITYAGARAPRPLLAVDANRPLRILIIDDDETARYTLANYATHPGAEIYEAENGLQGIARASADRPDVILLDLMMPGIGGHEVLVRLKSDPTTSDIPVVIVTSRFVNDDERRQILIRAANVVYKGDLSRETVTHAITDALQR